MGSLRSIIAAALVTTLGASVATAAAETLDFEALGGTNDIFYPSPLTVGSYQFSGNFIGDDYVVFGTSSAESFAGSFALTPFGGETHTFQRSDSGAFDLLSLDFSEHINSQGSGSITWTGAKVGGGTVTAILTSDGTFGFEPFNFVNFVNLSSITFTTTRGFDDRFQYDNMVLRSTPAIPLPAGLPMALAGLSLLGFVAWRRNG